MDVAPVAPVQAIPGYPSHVVSPDFSDYTRPQLAIWIAYDNSGKRFELLSTDGVLTPRRCIFVTSAFWIHVNAQNPKGVGFIQVGTPPYTIMGLTPRSQPNAEFTAGASQAGPSPDSATQTNSTFSPNPYRNPGAWPGSRSVEVNYQSGNNDRIYDSATLRVFLQFAPNLPPEHAYTPIRISARAATVATSSIDGLVLRLAGPGEQPGSACAWQELT